MITTMALQLSDGSMIRLLSTWILLSVGGFDFFKTTATSWHTSVVVFGDSFQIALFALYM
jgi:hypothetical protein